MKGVHHIIVSNSSVKYDFDIKRNITIIKGDSASGKTTLVEMIAEYHESGADSGITLLCDKPCRVLEGREWRVLLATMNDSIVFIDEGNRFLLSDDFAEAVRKSDNYYVIITREGLVNLPYSVEEIYGIRTSGKYAGLKQIYHEFYHIYGDHTPHETVLPETVIVEDSNSGYEFFEGLSKEKGYQVVSAGGKSNVFKEAYEHRNEKLIVVADGAAFGAEMDRLTRLVTDNPNIVLFLPESFEWMVLYADLFTSGELHRIMEMPSDYIESSEYFSWERYFTHLLVELSKDTYLRYSKKSLNKVYLQEDIARKILKNVVDIGFL